MLHKIIPVLLLTIVFSHAVEEKALQSVMEAKVTKVLNTLKNTQLTQKQKEQRSVTVMDSIFDYAIMSKISMGKRWRTLSKAERKQFTQAFEKKIKHSYVDKLRLYNNQEVKIKPYKKIKPTRITLENIVMGKNENYQVVYQFYKKKSSNEWYIYDVRLAGVSIVQTYRKQFADYLKTKTFAQLLASL